MPAVPQSTTIDQLYSISIKGLNRVAPKWSNRVASSNVGHLEFSLGQWCAIVRYQIPCRKYVYNYCSMQVNHGLDVYSYSLGTCNIPNFSG